MCASMLLAGPCARVVQPPPVAGHGIRKPSRTCPQRWAAVLVVGWLSRRGVPKCTGADAIQRQLLFFVELHVEKSYLLSLLVMIKCGIWSCQCDN